MAIQDEYKLDRFGSIRPPRNVMLGGLARAAAAGQQSTSNAIAGGATPGQMSSAMNPKVQSLVAGLQVDQANQRNASTMTELRRLSAVDNMNDARASLDAQFRAAEPDIIDKVAMGAKIAVTAAAIAGRVEDAGSDTKSTEKTLLDDAGNPVLNSEGKPITYTEKSRELSGTAKVAARIQDVIGAVIPSVKRDVKARREDELSLLENSNQKQLTAAEEKATATARRAATVASLDGVGRLIASINSTGAYNVEYAGEVAKMQRELEEVRAYATGGFVPVYADSNLASEIPEGFVGPPSATDFTWEPPKAISPDSLAAVSKYDEQFKLYGEKSGIDPLLLKAHALVESGGNPRAVSWAGAQGLMQFMPGTASDYSLQNPFDPIDSIRAASDYLSTLTKLFDGDMTYAVAAYNAGQGNVQRTGLLKAGNYPAKVKWHYKQLGGTRYWGDQ